MNTVLVTVDALRADHLGQYGYDRDTMPVLDRVAAEGAVFEDAYANGPYTRVSVPSFHTSTYLGYRNVGDVATIASALSDAGITTACIGTQTGFTQVEADLGFDDYVDLGRDDYQDRAKQSEPLRVRLLHRVNDALDHVPRVQEVARQVYEASPFGEPFPHLGYTSAEAVTDRAVEWIQGQEDDFFLWIHYMEGHRPYGVHDPDPVYAPDVSEERIHELMKAAGTAPESVSGAERDLMVDLYDSDLRYCSRHLARLFDALEDAGVWDETNVVFTSDHGEEFYEHGNYFHRNLPYDELLHVPLLVRTPGGEPERVAGQRELLDLGPTILDLHDVPVPDTFEGESVFDGDAREVVAVGSQQDVGQVVAGRWDGWKYIWTGEDEHLFDLDADPAEAENVADDRSDIRDRFRQDIPADLFDAPPEELQDVDDEDVKERLEALGYMEMED